MTGFRLHNDETIAAIGDRMEAPQSPLPSRRRFLAQTAAVAAASAWPSVASATDSGPGDLLSQMTWLNAPPSWQVQGGSLTVKSAAKADFYRLPGWAVDNGNLFRMSIAGDFQFDARITGQLVARYDQAGLMARIDSENWMKCGMEWVDGVRYASVVVTRKYSDWSTMPDPAGNGPVWWRLIRSRESLKMQCSADGAHFTTVREAYFPAAPELTVGLLTASLEGTGVTATFDSLRLSKP